MKDFVNLVPLVEVDNIYYPEIRLAKNIVLQIEFPINISCTNGSGLSHKGIGGHFNFWFKKDRKRYQILFQKERIEFRLISNSMKTVWCKTYSYIELIKFIKEVNKNRCLLYDK
jgi:hypothetical protein